MKKYTLTTKNDFYDGWIGYLLNQAKPEDQGGECGWECADDTTEKTDHPLFGRRDFLAIALRAEIGLGHIVIEAEDIPDDRARPKITNHGNGSLTVEMPEPR